MNAERLRALADAATPGPWKAHDIPYDGLDDPTIMAGSVYIAQTVYDMQSMTTEHNVDADTAFIAACRTAIPELLDEIDRLTTALAAAEERLATARTTRA